MFQSESLLLHVLLSVVLFLKTILCIYLFLAVLGPRCRSDFPLVVENRICLQLPWQASLAVTLGLMGQ